MDCQNKENIEPEKTPDKAPKVRVEELNMNASDEESDKGEWAVVYNESDSSVEILKTDTFQKIDKADLDNSNDNSIDNDDHESDDEDVTDNGNLIRLDDLEQYSSTENVDYDHFDLNMYDIPDYSQPTTATDKASDQSKPFIDLKDLHNFGLKIDQIDLGDYSDSDIDIIEDEMSNSLLCPNDANSEMSVSLCSVVSQYSTLSARKVREHFLKQIAEGKLEKEKRFLLEMDPNSSDVNADNRDSPDGPIRAYVHQRNAVLNGKLTLILVLSITAVFGLGIGHFIGWSNHFNYSNRLSMAQVIKLKQLQDDLLVCMRVQNEDDFESNGFKNNIPFKEVCHRDYDYWKNRFETFFEENKGMKELFERTQKHFHDTNEAPIQEYEYVTEMECVNKTTSEAFNKLEVPFLVRQMEHLNMLEVLKQVKKSEKQVKYLREENEGLKKKLEEEEQDDEVIVQEWNTKVTQLQEQNQELVKSIVDDEEEDRKVIESFERKIETLSGENEELRLIITQLENQMNGPLEKNNGKYQYINRYRITHPHGKDYLDKYINIRDNINQLMSENQDMKADIARYRWHEKNQDSQEQKMEVDKKFESFRTKFAVLQRQLQLEQEDSKRWRHNFENLLHKFRKMESERKNQDNERFNSGPKRTNQEPNYESIPAKGQKFLNKFYDELKDKWQDLNKKYKKKLNEAYEHVTVNFEKFDTNEKLRKQGDKLVKFGQYLETVMESVQNYSENLIERGRKSQVMSFLSDKLTDLSNIIENNFVVGKGNKKQQQQSSQTPPPSSESTAGQKQRTFRSY